MPISDTSPEARAQQFQILLAMPGEDRVVLAYEMSMFVREVMREGIRRDHPDWTGKEVEREILSRAFFPAPLPTWLR